MLVFLIVLTVLLFHIYYLKELVNNKVKPSLSEILKEDEEKIAKNKELLEGSFYLLAFVAIFSYVLLSFRVYGLGGSPKLGVVSALSIFALYMLFSYLILFSIMKIQKKKFSFFSHKSLISLNSLGINLEKKEVFLLLILISIVVIETIVYKLLSSLIF